MSADGSTTDINGLLNDTESDLTGLSHVDDWPPSNTTSRRVISNTPPQAITLALYITRCTLTCKILQLDLVIDS
ncbi:unnamed protein product [Plutella xylostella]|uniref:(diamondback moth) hypothetical protein n=1 Tax=Plutella xylostella TaxID=51655 RepID=A0A8S4G7S0_PLUXY|nr:unnamed protein product [Plutella xylostella]